MVVASRMIGGGQNGYFLLIKLILQLVKRVDIRTTKTRWMDGNWWTKQTREMSERIETWSIQRGRLMNDDSRERRVTAKRNTANPVRNEVNDESAAPRTECDKSSRRFLRSDPFNVKWRISADDQRVILTFTWLDIFVCQRYKGTNTGVFE